jgi:two-component system response regulator HydG
LYHRINEVTIDLPPLRERLDDISELTRFFLRQSGVMVNGDEKNFKQMVKSFTYMEWPGNVRQLQAEIRRLALLSEGKLSRMVEAVADNLPDEREQLLDLLNATGWNRREVARRLNLSEATIRRRIKRHKLAKPQ